MFSNRFRPVNAASLSLLLFAIGCAKADFKVKVFDQNSSVDIEISNFSNTEKCFYWNVIDQVQFIPPQSEPLNIIYHFDLETATIISPKSTAVRNYEKATIFSPENLPIEKYTYKIELYPCGLGGYAEAAHKHRDKMIIITGEGQVIE